MLTKRSRRLSLEYQKYLHHAEDPRRPAMGLHEEAAGAPQRTRVPLVVRNSSPAVAASRPPTIA